MNDCKSFHCVAVTHMIEMELNGLNRPLATTSTPTTDTDVVVIKASTEKENKLTRAVDGLNDDSLHLSWVQKIQKFVADVFEITSIHGFAYLTKEGTHAIER